MNVVAKGRQFSSRLEKRGLAGDYLQDSDRIVGVASVDMPFSTG